MAEASSARNLFDSVATITVLVGKDDKRREFILPKYYANQSEFIRRTVINRIRNNDPTPCIIEMAEDSPMSFDLYKRFLYTDRVLADSPHSMAPNDPTKPPWPFRMYDELMTVYLIAEKLQDTTTKNKVIRKIYEQHCNEDGYFRRQPDAQSVNLIYRSTVHDSPLRRLFVHSSAGSVVPLFNVEELPKEFLTDIIRLQSSILMRYQGSGMKYSLSDFLESPLDADF